MKISAFKDKTKPFLNISVQSTTLTSLQVLTCKNQFGNNCKASMQRGKTLQLLSLALLTVHEEPYS